ncbi:hypothetical protein BKA65DRAFT_569876 [Rhexocercosporidium sp. MPI-PUGE-AT-0058]|nr:hypothetical protein BKA65DRAFT_569876 [Rhexocercosporidium sp. MPI-PUGE-AT-0058]
MSRHEDLKMSSQYTMETFVHHMHREQALSDFFSVLKPGRRLALYEYDHDSSKPALRYLSSYLDQINKYAAMPSNTLFKRGILLRMLEDAGFENVIVEDLSITLIH